MGKETKYNNLDKSAAYGKLTELAPQGKNFDFKNFLTAERVKDACIPIGETLAYNWAAKSVNKEILDALQCLADEQELIPKYRDLLEGAVMNPSENRLVLHHLLRSPDAKAITGKSVAHNGEDLGEFYLAQLKKVYKFADKVRSEGRYTNFVQIGIGGSDLGPRAFAIALKNWAAGEGKEAYRTEFISNVDPDDAAAITESLPLDKTLFILVSKSGTTIETLTNELFVKEKLTKAGLDPADHMVAVTSQTSPLAKNKGYLASFYFDDFIGGRYSVCSPVGALILSLAYGSEVFREFLVGANEADIAALEPCIRKNAALLDALIGIWERNFLNYPCSAILPYSQALLRFTAHIQQLDMESNGKSVNRSKEPIAYPTGPVIFGEPGTNGQHSFYQLLHQGTDIIPLQFIGFKESQRKDDITIKNSTSQTKLNANLAAQITAFANGQEDLADKNKHFAGGRPSSLIYGERLTPKALGALLAHYENKVMFQGFAWNLNSFDQEGVQLGKTLAGKVLSKTGSGSGDSVLDAYSDIFGI